MAGCCEDKACELRTLRESHGRVLWIVLGINTLMFVVEGSAGLLAHSTSLLADALDMLATRLCTDSASGTARSVLAGWRGAREGGFMLVGLASDGSGYKVFIR
jgi:hypothetical protein